MKVCKHCGEINSGDSAFCCNCGNTNFIFQEETVCPRCGAVNDKSFTFCINCGADMSVAATDPQSSPAPTYSDAADIDIEATTVANAVANLYGGVIINPSETSKCPNCGAAVPITSIFCNHCGTSVADLHEHRVVQRKVCPQCGRPNSLEAHYCSYCFASLAEAETEDMQVVHDSQNLGEMVVRQVMLESPNGKKLICPGCGTLNNRDEQYCESCGLTLSVDEPKRYCPNCGAENSADDAFCTKCRWSFTNATSNSVDMWTCECGYANEKEDKYCSKCGKKRKK